MAEPRTIIHGDWSKDRRKRVAAVARRDGSGYRVETIAPFGDLFPDAEALLREPPPVLVGFDFPSVSANIIPPLGGVIGPLSAFLDTTAGINQV